MTITISVTVPFEPDDMSEEQKNEFNRETEQAIKDLVGWDAPYYYVHDERAVSPYFLIERDGGETSERYDYSQASGWLPEGKGESG